MESTKITEANIMAVATSRVYKYLLATLFLLMGGMVHCLPAQAMQQQSHSALFTQNINKNEYHAGILKKVISVDLNNAPFERGLRIIAKKAGLKLVFSEDIIPAQKSVSLHKKNIKLEDALWALLAGTDLRFGISSHDHLVVMKSSEKDEKAEKQIRQLEAVSGTVTDATSGEALPSVNIKVKGTTTGTFTDDEGHYELSVPSLQDTLVFSFVGYQKKTVPINGRTTVNVAMRMQTISGEEMVVVGYGEQKKVNVTGSVSSISSENLSDKPITNVSSALEGQLSGVTITQQTGQPGKDQGTIHIRGIGTLGNSNPMVVVDGVASSLDNLNPDDIASISVLKDAASAAIYGSRAANGVILVTTKEGNKGGIQAHYNMYIGQQRRTRTPNYVPSWQAATLYNKALVNEGHPRVYNDAEIQKFKDGSDPYNYPNTDWMNLYYQGSGIQQNHYVDVSGGNENTQSLFSLGYYSQDGIALKTGDTKYSTRFNINSRLSSRFSVDGNLSYSVEDFKEPLSPTHGQQYSIVQWAVNRISKMVPYKYSDGIWGYNDDGNPIRWVKEGGIHTKNTHKFSGIVNGDWEIIPNLHLKPLLSYQLTQNKSRAFVKDLQYHDHNSGAETIYEGPTSLLVSHGDNSVITAQALLQYQTSLNRDNTIKILGGASDEYTKFDDLSGFRKSFLNHSLSQLDAAPITGQQTNGSAYELELASVFGRINYDFRDRYLLEGNIRYDGSSRFAPSNRWGLFPSFSIGWRVSEESFFAPLKSVINDLKLRASWGKLGNQQIGSIYPYISTINTGLNYTFGNSVAAGIGPVNGTNRDIRWEETKSKDIGLDASLIEGKISLTANYFIRNTYNILLNLPVSSTYGFNSPVQNAASVRNKGIELDLGYHGALKNLTYNISGNASYIINKVTDLHGIGPIINSGFSFLQKGYPINSFYGYEAEGIFDTQQQVENHATQAGGVIAPGDIMYKDQNGDGVIDGDDRVYLGSFTPKITYGLNLSVGWKNFDLNLFLQGVGGVKGLIMNQTLGKVGAKDGKPTAIFLDHWTPDNKTDKFPRMWNQYTQNDPSVYNSSFWVRNADYMRIKNLEIGYTLPFQWLKEQGVQRLKVYYSGQNLLTFSPFYNWVDPELPPGGDADYTYPQVMVNTIGLKLTF